jgi:hypothetical protein
VQPTHNRLTSSARVVEVDGAGWGAIAANDIPAGAVVATFGGMPCRIGVLRGLAAGRRSRSIQIDDDLFLAGPPEREPGDCVNHSCEPNCGPRGAATIVAARDIAVGETLSFDYATTDGSDYDEFDCACGTRACRGRIRGTDWRRPSVRARHGVAFSPYLCRRMHTAKRGRTLGKSDTERLLRHYDSDPEAALATALRAVLGRPWSRFVDLVDGLRLEDGLHGDEADRVTRGEDRARDALLVRLAELRGADLLGAFSALPD